MEERKIAEFILGMVDMGVASELPEEGHLDLLVTDLEEIKGSNLYYYLLSGCEQYKE